MFSSDHALAARSHCPAAGIPPYAHRPHYRSPSHRPTSTAGDDIHSRLAAGEPGACVADLTAWLSLVVLANAGGRARSQDAGRLPSAREWSGALVAVTASIANASGRFGPARAARGRRVHDGTLMRQGRAARCPLG